jgi:acylphosphatase
MTRRCVRALVRGRVQGVGFRWSAQERARQLGLDGWVRNLSDGRVETWAEGDAGAVELLLAWLREGPRYAGVDRLEVFEEESAGLEGFDIRPTRVT